MNPPPHFLTHMIAMTLVAFAIHFYLWRRLIKDTALPGRWSKVVTVLIGLLAASIPFSMVLTRTVSPALARNVLLVPFLWAGVMAFLLAGAAVVDFAKMSVKVARRVFVRFRRGGKPPVSQVSSKLEDPKKSLFLSRVAACVIVLASGSLAVAGFVRGKSEPRVHRVTVSLSKFPSTLNGFRIVQLTDLHIGGILDSSWLKRVVEDTNRLRPDLVAITGDLVDGRVDMLLPELAPLTSLKARYGVFFVTGNHEYYSGAKEWIPAVQNLGFRVLRNEHVIIGEGEQAFALVGVDDRNAAKMMKGHGPDLGKALAGVPRGMETILLAHQPKQILDAARKDIGLLLCGHTHGGQMWPLTVLVSIQQPYTKGLFTHRGSRTQIFISQGTGFWGPPMRIGTENEIAEIRLLRKAFRPVNSPSSEK